MPIFSLYTMRFCVGSDGRNIFGFSELLWFCFTLWEHFVYQLIKGFIFYHSSPFFSFLLRLRFRKTRRRALLPNLVLTMSSWRNFIYNKKTNPACKVFVSASQISSSWHLRHSSPGKLTVSHRRRINSCLLLWNSESSIEGSSNSLKNFFAIALHAAHSVLRVSV